MRKKAGTVVTHIIFGALHGALDALEKSIAEGSEEEEDDADAEKSPAAPLTVVKDEEADDTQ